MANFFKSSKLFNVFFLNFDCVTSGALKMAVNKDLSPEVIYREVDLVADHLLKTKKKKYEWILFENLRFITLQFKYFVSARDFKEDCKRNYYGLDRI